MNLCKFPLPIIFVFPFILKTRRKAVDKRLPAGFSDRNKCFFFLLTKMPPAVFILPVATVRLFLRLTITLDYFYG